ncbi:MAG: FHA domain-containing protein [Methylacidiphilales bacterium]|nr:FHA domain-containing protein [Candidatus Methylacidiphilales bacterium]
MEFVAMDFTVLQLFTPEEILDRLGKKKGTGCLHLYTTSESANIFLKDGIVVTMTNGSVEGIDILKQVLTWKDVHCTWQPEIAAPGIAFKPLHVHVQDILAQLHTTAEPARMASAPARISGVLPASAEKSSPLIHQSIGTKGKTTAPIEPLNSPAPKATLLPLAEAIAPVQMTATKNFNPTAQDRSIEEEALLKKHRLVLVSVDNPDLRLKITRASGLLGRNPACELPISHPSISRQHCLLQLSNRGLNLKDLGTTNGTKVNGIALTQGLVNIGDKLTFGHLTFLLERDKE